MMKRETGRLVAATRCPGHPRRFALVVPLLLAALLIAGSASAQSAGEIGGFELEADASSGESGTLVAVVGHSTTRLALDCASWRYDSNVELLLNGPELNLRTIGQKLLLEQRDGTAGQVQMGLQVTTNLAIMPDMSFSYGARYKRPAPFAAGYGRLNWVTAAGQEQRDFMLPENTLTPVQSWWAMVDAVKSGARHFTQDVSVLGLLGSIELGDGVKGTVTFDVVASPFDEMALPDDPDGAFVGRSWAVRAQIPTRSQRYDGAKTIVFQLFESGVTGYEIAERPDATVLLKPVRVSLLQAPKC
jgi:hypothetical protein